MGLTNFFYKSVVILNYLSLVLYLLVNMLRQLFIIFILNSVYCETLVPFLFRNHMCASDECKQMGFDIYSSINTTVNPCDNFYEFSCGNWLAKNNKPNFEPLWNHHLRVSYKINRRIQTILENSYDVDKSSSLGKSISFYKACVDINKEKGLKYLENLRILLYNFSTLASQNSGVENSKIFLEIAKIARILKIHPILKMSVNIDYKNTSNYAIYIEPGNLVYPQHILLNPINYPVELNAYRRWILETFTHVYRDNLKSLVKVTKIIDFEIKLARMMRRARMERTTVGDITKKLKMDITQAFNLLFKKEDQQYIKNDDIVIVKNFYYLKSLLMLLKRTDIKTVVNYLLWSVMRDLSRETTKYMRNLNFVVDKTVLGIESDLSRKIECINKVKDYFGYAVVPEYISKHFSDDSMEKIKEMIKHIKIEFMKLLGNNQWLSEETKLLAVEKVNAIKGFVGFPQYFKEKKNIEKYYEEFNMTHDHFSNMLKIKNIMSERDLLKINQSVQETIWPSNVFEVNAFYSILQNTVFIPLGLLEPPFYYKHAPSFINYGAIGSLIGHEISHSLDSAGRQANKDGIVSKWWPRKDIYRYQLYTRCFINQYNNYNINGFLTVGENIADNIGLEIALNAYRNLKKSENYKLIPYMEMYTNDQLFFISFAQMWCEISNREDLFYEEHSSVKNRVNGTISNNKHFTNDFECRRNYTQKQCTLW